MFNTQMARRVLRFFHDKANKKQTDICADLRKVDTEDVYWCVCNYVFGNKFRVTFKGNFSVSYTTKYSPLPSPSRTTLNMISIETNCAKSTYESL